MVHRFVPRCQIGPGHNKASASAMGVWGVWCVRVSEITTVPRPRFRGLGTVLVCARWCPTLPHPGGCSTIGAVRLSFRVRDGSGRFPVAVTTETTTWAVRQCVLVILLSGRLSTHTRVCAWCVWLVVWVGCGPYSGRFALLWLLTPARV